MSQKKKKPTTKASSKKPIKTKIDPELARAIKDFPKIVKRDEKAGRELQKHMKNFSKLRKFFE